MTDCFCGAPMVLRESRYGPFLGCTRYPDCDGIASLHPDGSLKGTPTDEATRAARIAAHEAFDKLWRGPQREVSRKDAYRWMQRVMGLPEEEAHIGHFTADQCRELLAHLERRGERVVVSASAWCGDRA